MWHTTLLVHKQQPTKEGDLRRAGSGRRDSNEFALGHTASLTPLGTSNFTDNHRTATAPNFDFIPLPHPLLLLLLLPPSLLLFLDLFSLNLLPATLTVGDEIHMRRARLGPALLTTTDDARGALRLQCFAFPLPDSPISPRGTPSGLADDTPTRVRQAACGTSPIRQLHARL